MCPSHLDVSIGGWVIHLCKISPILPVGSSYFGAALGSVTEYDMWLVSTSNRVLRFLLFTGYDLSSVQFIVVCHTATFPLLNKE